MTMIAVGQGLRGIANRGFAAGAAAEKEAERQAMALEAQKTAAASQTMGTGAGIGGMVGATKVGQNAKAAKDAVGALNKSLTGKGTVGLKGGGLTFTPAGSETVLTGVDATDKITNIASALDSAPVTEVAQGASEVVSGALEAGGVVDKVAPVAEVLAGTGEVAGTVGTVGTEVAATGAVATEAAAAGTAAASTGPMAAMATLAAPIAIGLGVSFLISKFFD